MTNESFGYLRITVERPLRLRWEITDETLAIARADKRLIKLADGLDALSAALADHLGLSNTDRKQVAKTVDPILRSAGLNAQQQRAVWEAIAVRDPEAPPILNRKGEPEADPELRDQENVPLPTVRVGFEEDPSRRFSAIEYRNAIEDHLEREIHPYVPDPWIDNSKTKIGYEIPLTRHFYKYVPPRPLEQIDAEIKQLEAEIQDLLREVTSETG
jgi:type I restriction enzyme M protein